MLLDWLIPAQVLTDGLATLGGAGTRGHGRVTLDGPADGLPSSADAQRLLSELVASAGRVA